METITEADAEESGDVTTPAVDLPGTKATSPSKESAAADKPAAGDEKEGEEVDIDLMEEKEDEPKPVGVFPDCSYFAFNSLFNMLSQQLFSLVG